MLIISGAFGLFRRDAVIAVGGYDKTALGEDMDLTVRLHQFHRRRRLPYRIAFDPHPLCWTQAPEDRASLKSQRCRWRRGILQVLWRHRRLIGNPRYGIVGLAMMPYTAFVEGLGPLVEVVGYVVATAAAFMGVLDWYHYLVLLMVSLLFGAAVTLLAVLLDDMATRRYGNPRDLARLMSIAVLENFGYRQLNAWWGLVGTLQAVTGRGGGWGAIKRRSF
jgi:cellulose synthase/poly-beta-1,6-N-acetylglucosamine synthase-like glycosyltransferase